MVKIKLQVFLIKQFKAKWLLGKIKDFIVTQAFLVNKELILADYSPYLFFS